MINAAEFLNTVYNDTPDTQRIPIPAGEYIGQIGTGDKDVAVDSGVSQKNQQPWARIDINITIPDPSGAIKTATGRDPVVTRHGVMIEVTPEGKLDTSAGKNIRLFKVFAAAGWPTDAKGRLQPGWNFAWLKGKQVKIKMAHEPNKDDSSAQPYERVDAITKP